MNRTVTFYGTGRDQYGMPTPYHRYFIVEGPAPWLGQNSTAASIKEEKGSEWKKVPGTEKRQ